MKMIQPKFSVAPCRSAVEHEATMCNRFVQVVGLRCPKCNTTKDYSHVGPSDTLVYEIPFIMCALCLREAPQYCLSCFVRTLKFEQVLFQLEPVLEAWNRNSTEVTEPPLLGEETYHAMGLD